MKTAGWDNWVEEDEEDLRIIEFGEAFLQGAEPKRLAQPDTFCEHRKQFSQAVPVQTRSMACRYRGEKAALRFLRVGRLTFVDRFIHASWEGFLSTIGEA